VGLPLFLGSVAVTSLIVHASIMTHTTWMGTYWMGSKARTAMQTEQTQKTAAAQPGAAFSMTLTPVPATASAPASFVITVNNAAGEATSTTVPAATLLTTQPTTEQPAREAAAKDAVDGVTVHASNAN